MNDNIIKGYYGIMDLDLSRIDPKFHRELINQHKKDIEEYKLEQKMLPLRLRYENTIVKAFSVNKMDSTALTQRRKEQDELWEKQYKKRIEIYNKIQKQKEHNI